MKAEALSLRAGQIPHAAQLHAELLLPGEWALGVRAEGDELGADAEESEVLARVVAQCLLQVADVPLN